MQYLLDTDWAIDYLNKHSPVVQRLEKLAPAGLGISIISVAELYEGVLEQEDSERKEQELREFLHGVEVLPVNEAICRIFARERGRLRAAGARIEDFDLLIGATAIHHNLTVLTNNRRHFQRLEDLTILSA